MTASGNRHAAAAGSFLGLFWCAMGKMACAIALVVVEYAGAGGNRAVVAALLVTLAATACLLMADWAYISPLRRFSSHPKWLAYSRSAALGAIAALAGLVAMFIGAVTLSVCNPLGWSAGVTVASGCARAGAVAAATGIFLFYIRTSQMCATCALVHRSRALQRSAGHVLQCFWALLCAATAAGILLLLVGTLAAPRPIRIVVDMVTLAARGFGLYCLIVHLMLLIRTAAVLDLTATEEAG